MRIIMHVTRSGTSLEHTTTLVALVAVIALGLSAGAMLAEGAILVPYWRSLPATAFLAWYRDNAMRLVDFFGPLEVAAALLPLAAAGLYRISRRARAGLLVISAVLAVSVLAAYPMYFRDVNASFAAGTIAVDAVADELARWAAWHWMRIAIGIAAFMAALVAVRQ